MPSLSPTPLVLRGGLGRRETSVDVLRGWFIISMTIAHLSAESIADKVTHAAVWIDGAIGFVTLSGLVLGLVYRRTSDRTGRIPFRKVLRRARLLYGIQVVVLVLALAVRSSGSRFDDVPHPESIGGWAGALWLAATLRLPAANLDVLPMYVLFLLAAVPALHLLSRSRARLLLLLSLAVYGFATVFPELAIPSGVHFNWGAWQLPFMLGLMVGWFWDELRVAALLRSRRSVLLSATVAGACLLVAQAFGRFGLLDGTEVDEVVGSGFEKFNLGPAHIVFGLAAMALGYAAVSALRDVRPLVPLWRWLALLGSRSLDAFVILCLAVIVLPALVAYEASSATAMALVVVTLLAQTMWIVLRRRGYLPGLATGTEHPSRSPGRRADRTPSRAA